MKKLLFLLSLCGLTFSQQIPVSVFVEAGGTYFSPPVTLKELNDGIFNTSPIPAYRKFYRPTQKDFKMGLNLKFFSFSRQDVEADISYSFTNGSFIAPLYGISPGISYRYTVYTKRLNLLFYLTRDLGKNYFVRAGLGCVYVLSANEERVGFIEEVAYRAVSLQTRRLGSFNLLYSLGIRKELKKGWKLGLHYSRELFTWDYEQNPVGGLITNIWSFRVSKRIASKANAE